MTVAVGARIAAAAASVVAVAVLWAVVVPWDLSEIDAVGRPRAGLDRHWTEVAAVGIAAAAIGLTAGLLDRTAPLARLIATSTMVTWAVLLGWRASAARTDGASLFAVPFVFVVLPVTAIVPWVAGRVAQR